MTARISKPLGFQELQHRISTLARDSGAPVDRLHHRLGTDVLFGVLDLARSQGIIDSYAVKGGVGLEVRFGMRARATKDVDLTLAVPYASIPGIVNSVFAIRFGHFDFRLKGPLEVMERVQTYRAVISIRYLGRILVSLPLDINATADATAVDLIPSELLNDLGLGDAVSVPIIDAHAQLAHKLHGATQPSTNGYQNERCRDVIDSLILEDAGLDYDRARMFCRAEFGKRSTHGWPPMLELDDRWRAGISSAAARTSYSLLDPDAIARRFNRLIADIEGDAMYEVLETRTFDVNPDNFGSITRGAQDGTAQEIAALLATGWQIAHVVSDANGATRALVVLERRRVLASRAPSDVPRLQAHLEMRNPSIPGQQNVTPLEGDLRNVGATANDVRMIVPGVAQDYAAR